MGHRLSKIYTRTGDEGTTGLADGSRVSKTDLRVEVFGTLDELNSAIGVALAHEKVVIQDKSVAEKKPFSREIINDDIHALLEKIQNELFDLGSEFCLPGYLAMTDDHVFALEKALDQMNEDLPPLKEFILPGGHPLAAHCHLARTICRRAERLAVQLNQESKINPAALKYLNRLSDLLFVIARKVNQIMGVAEPCWKHQRK